MAQRLLAVLGAVAIVLAAIVMRAAIDNDDDGTGSDGQGGDGGALVVVCATDLAEVCSDLDGVTIIEQDAATTATALGAGDGLDGVDGWVTTSAWVEVVDARAPERLGDATPVATSPVIVAADPSRAAAVTSLCEGQPLWGCLGTNAGMEWGRLGNGGQASWGTLKTGLPSADSAVGLNVLASAAIQFFNGPDFARNDFDSAGLRDWLDDLTEPSGKGERSPIGTLVTTRGKYTTVGDVAAAAANRHVEVLDGPGVEATVVAVMLPGGDDLPNLAPIRDALVAAGWDPADNDSEPRPTLKPGVMAALHTLWMEVT